MEKWGFTPVLPPRHAERPRPPPLQPQFKMEVIAAVGLESGNGGPNYNVNQGLLSRHQQPQQSTIPYSRSEFENTIIIIIIIASELCVCVNNSLSFFLFSVSGVSVC